MKFEEALIHLKKRKKIKLEQNEVRIIDTVTMFSEDVIKTIPEVQFRRTDWENEDGWSEAHFDVNDILSNDWEVVE